MLDRFLKIFKPKTTLQYRYPELEKAGGLENAIDIEFEKLNSDLRVTRNNQLDKIPFTFALIAKDEKFSQVYIGAEKKLYLPDFWKEGVCLANGQTKNISELAQALDYWLCNDITAKVLAKKYSFIVPTAKAAAFDEHNEVNYTWNFFLQEQSALSDFIKLAIEDEVLNKLFPFTSLYTLCFSRCTGYPYDTDDVPHVTPKQFEHLAPFQLYKMASLKDNNTSEAQFVVAKNEMGYLGEGNAAEALRIVKENLPGNIGVARKGTADE